MSTHRKPSGSATRTATEDLAEQIVRILEIADPRYITRAASLLNDLRLEFERESEVLLTEDDPTWEETP